MLKSDVHDRVKTLLKCQA